GSLYCGVSQAWPCMYWQDPQHYSITIYGEINLSLTSMPPHWLPDMADAFNDFNSVPGANPFQYACQTAGCGQVDYYGGVVSCPLLATTGYLITNTEYSSTFGWYSFFSPYNIGVTYDNESRANWNESDTYSVNGCNFSWDARYAARHETGHVQSLGHTGYAAIMSNAIPSPVFHTLQPNDKSGLEGIYTGTQPSS